MNLKRIIIVFCVGLFWNVVFGQSVEIVPMYNTDERFPPTFVYHTSCEQIFDIFVDTQTITTELITIKLSFPSSLRITTIQKSQDFDTEVSKVINTGMMSYTLNSSRPLKGKKKFATVSFVVSSGIKNQTLRLMNDSILVNSRNSKAVNISMEPIMFKFADVPSCLKDKTLPSVTLISPSLTGNRISVNTDFMFQLRDTGWGINWNDVFVIIDGYKYTSKTVGFSYSGDSLLIKPLKSLPYNTSITLSLQASDLQVYGGKNTLSTGWTFVTSAEPNTCKELGCNIGFKYDMSDKNVLLSGEFCKQLSKLKVFLSSSGYDIYNQLNGLYNCNLEIISDDDSLEDNKTLPIEQVSSQKTSLSLFAFIGWMLFVLVFVLKWIYFIRYKRLKYKLKS